MFGAAPGAWDSRTTNCRDGAAVVGSFMAAPACTTEMVIAAQAAGGQGGGPGLPCRRAPIGGMTIRRIVVVGNGLAGLTACDSLRSTGFDGELTVVGAERHHPYGRPALFKALLQGDYALQAHELPEPTHEATEVLGVSATGLDVEARLVSLDGGGELPYDGLVIASGSRQPVPRSSCPIQSVPWP
ncbi:FAD/NAD(P)-binding oxidoreductase [Arthrobacter sp. UYEF21]|uniref:FAD/NAD(P)-binding oxidoreductase n=1 Tax=Arthrobacter sp. UYEF21 TaxID=1756364 RepID=UPI00339B6A96